MNQPVVMAETGNYLPSSVHIQSLYRELILMVANNTKEPVKRTIVTVYNGKWEVDIKSDYLIIMFQVIKFSSYKLKCCLRQTCVDKDEHPHTL